MDRLRTHLPAVLMAGLLAGCTGGGAPADTERLASSTAPTGTVIETPEATPSGPPRADLADRTIATIQLEGGPDYPTAAFGSMWVLAADTPDPRLYRIDPATNELVATISLPERGCNGIAAGFESVWSCSPDGVVRIDPATNEIAFTIPFPTTRTESRLAIGPDAVWALSGADPEPNTVVRIDPATNAVQATIPLGHPVQTLVYAFDAVWITSPADGVLLRVDPSSGEVTTVLSGLPEPGYMAAGAGSLWLGFHGGPEAEAPPASEPAVVRVDPTSGQIEAEISGGRGLRTTGVYASDEVVWVRSSDEFLTRLDPATNAVVEVIEAQKGGGDVTVAYDSVWASSYDFNSVWRIAP